MQMQQISAFIAPEFVASHTLDVANIRDIRSSEGVPADPFVLGIADLWDTVRHLNRAFALIVKGGGRVGVAAASVIVEGRAGLNLGLLLPSLKRLPSPPLVAEPELRPFEQRYHRIVWDIATRLGRVEADRLLVFRIGKDTVRLQAIKAGFTFLDGCETVPEFLATLRAAADKALSVTYTLGESPTQEVPPQHRIYALFDAVEPGKGALQISPDGWPESVPSGICMTTIRALAAAVQRLHDHDSAENLSFSIIDTASKTILSGTRESKTVGLTLVSAGIVNG
jgi:hypothetical protein